MRAVRTERASPHADTAHTTAHTGGTGTAGAGSPSGGSGDLPESYRFPLNKGGSSAAARVFTRRCLNHWGIGDATPVGEDAVLIVSELVTNALLHADLAEELRLSRQASTLVIEVRDVGRGVPHVRRADDSEPGSRGLEIVSKLAHRWRVTLAPAGRKTVRAELRLAG